MIITIDGPAGAGKSTVSRALATRLGYRYLDTGAMYRAVTLVALESGDDPIAVAQGDAWSEHLLDPALRSDAVDSAVSGVSCLPEVRDALRGAQRDFLAQGDAVAEGRDIGSVVWPQAELKVWLDASPDERRRRRAAERGDEAGETALERDRKDAAQMIVPDDSVRVDTEGLSIEQVIGAIVQLVEERA
jgi:cytidylate kinase